MTEYKVLYDFLDSDITEALDRRRYAIYLAFEKAKVSEVSESELLDLLLESSALCLMAKEFYGESLIWGGGGDPKESSMLLRRIYFLKEDIEKHIRASWKQSPNAPETSPESHVDS